MCKLSVLETLKNRIDTIQSNYERLREEDLEVIRKLSNELESISTSNYAGGIPNSSYNRGDEGGAFSFPLKWAFTCKRMASSTYLSPVLDFYKAVFDSLEYTISFTAGTQTCGSDIADNKESEYIKKFVERQFKKAGGLKEFCSNVAVNVLTYGFYFFTPKLEVVDGSYYGIKGRLDGLYDFKFYDPTGLYNFTFDEKDTDKLSAISILTAPKKVGTVEIGNKSQLGFTETDILYSLITNEKSIPVNVVNIDVKSSIMGYATYGDITGNPIGKPFLYNVYSLWKIIDSMDISFNKNLENIGEHSFNFISSKTDGLDDSEIKEVEKDVRKYIKGKGGVFISKYGKIEKIEGIDGKKWNEIRDGIIATIWKSKGVDVKALGLTRGATKDLATMLQSDSVMVACSLMKDILRQINKTFLKNYFELNFKKQINTGIVDYPEIIITLPESTQNENSPQPQNLSAIEINTVKQSNNKTTFNILKSEPEGIEKEIIIDSKHLDDFLSSKIDELASELGIILKPKMKEAIKKIVENPRKPFNVWGMFDKAQFEKDIKEALIRIVKDSAIEEALYIASAFKLGNTTFEEQMKTDVYTFASNTADKYIKSNAFKDILSASMLDVEALVKDYAVKQNSSFVLTDKSQTNQIIKNLHHRVDNLKGRDFYDLAKNTALKTFTNVSDFENREAVNKVDNYAVLRSGILEGQCEYCSSRMGDIYRDNGNGDLVNDRGEVLTLPDPKCRGTLGGNTCRCFSILVPSLVLENNN